MATNSFAGTVLAISSEQSVSNGTGLKPLKSERNVGGFSLVIKAKVSEAIRPLTF